MTSKIQSKLMNDFRRNARVKNRSRLSWHIKDSELMGQARVLNLSSSGMLIEANSALEPNINSFLSLNSLSAKRNYFPQFGRIVWSKRIHAFKDKILFGVEFVNPSKEVCVRLTKAINRGLTKAGLLRNMGSMMEAVFVLAIIALIAYVMWLSTSIYSDLSRSSDSMLLTGNQQAALTQNYASMYARSQQEVLQASSKLNLVNNELNLVNGELASTSQLLETVNAELDSTKVVLAQTETMLAQAQSDLKSMQALNLKKINAVKAELNATIVALQEESLLLSTEMQHLTHKIDYYEGNVLNMDEGSSLIEFYREKMAAVKSRIKGFKLEATAARTAAQKEQERVKMILGNNGYLMRDGKQVVVDMEKYNAAILDEAGAAKGKVSVNVDFVE